MLGQSKTVFQAEIDSASELIDFLRFNAFFAQELYAELNQKNPNFKKLYDSYKAFQDDGYLWHQIADYTMDAYMIRYRNMKT